MVQEQNHIEISLIIPTYNSAGTVLDTITSAKSFFKHRHYEILLVDDGSTDSTVDLLEQRNYHVLAGRHYGVSHARNVGLNHARGEWVMFCDADDRLIGHLPHFQDSEIVSFSQLCRQAGVQAGIASKRKMIASLFGFNQPAPDFPAYYGGPVAKLFNRQFLNDHHLRFDEELANSEDVLFNTSAILAARSITTVKQGIYLYQAHANSATHSFDAGLLDNHLRFIAEMAPKLTTLSNDQQLMERVISLYLYQLVFRYFAFISNYRAEYSRWTAGVSSYHHGRWNSQLNRPVERLTIQLVNHFGLPVAVHFARAYLFAKRFKQSQAGDQLL